MIPPRYLTGKEALAWSTSAAFRKVVKGQLVCQALDSDEDDPDVEVYVLGVLAWSAVITDDPVQEFFDATAGELAAEERDILSTL